MSGLRVYHDQPWADVMRVIEATRPEIVTLEDSNGATVRLFVDWSSHDQLRKGQEETDGEQGDAKPQTDGSD